MRVIHADLGQGEVDTSGRAAGVAALLRRAGAVPGRPVAAVTQSAAALILLAEAAPMLGCPLFPLDPALPAATLAQLLDLAGSQCVIADYSLAGRTTISVGGLLAAPAADPLQLLLGDGDVALLIATSGSTGASKAVMLSEGNLAASAAASAALLPLGPEDRWLACLPLFHIGGFSILSRCARAGACAVVHDRFDAQLVAHDLDRLHLTHLSLVPAMLDRLLDAVADHPPPARLRHVLVGGAALSPQLAQRAVAAGWPIRPTYGMSETASQFATLPEVAAYWHRGLVGRPLPGAEVALDAGGRIMVRGPMVMAGYANSAVEPGDGLTNGWFVASDLGYLTEAGELVVLGRADDLLVSGGKTISPHQVEDMVVGCPGLGNAAVTAHADPVWGDVLVLAYTGGATPAAVLDWCKGNVPGPFRPRRAMHLAELPATSSGKLDRRSLRRLAEGDDAEAGTAGKVQPSA